MLRSKIFVYTLGPNPTKLMSFDTADNEEGTCDIHHYLTFSNSSRSLRYY